MCERSIGSVKQALRTFLDNSNQEQWDKYLQPLVYALNTAHKPSIEKTPFEVTYARTPRPIGAVSIHQPREKLTRAQQLLKAPKDREKARETILKAQANYTSRYNKGREEAGYQVGDIILIHNPATPPGLAPKLTKHWEGPFIITKILSPLVISARELEVPHRKRTVNIRRIKPFYTLYETKPPVQPGRGGRFQEASPTRFLRIFTIFIQF